MLLHHDERKLFRCLLHTILVLLLTMFLKQSTQGCKIIFTFGGIFIYGSFPFLHIASTIINLSLKLSIFASTKFREYIVIFPFLFLSKKLNHNELRIFYMFCILPFINTSSVGDFSLPQISLPHDKTSNSKKIFKVK